MKKTTKMKQIINEKIIKIIRIDKWQEEINILKSDISQIREYIMTIINNKE